MSEPSNTPASSVRPTAQSGDRPLTFEESVDRLQATVRRLESGELSLEDSLMCFEEGVRLTRACQEYLAGAERRIELLTRVNAETGPELEPFGNGQ